METYLTFPERLSLPGQVFCIRHSQGASGYVHYARIALSSVDLVDGVDG